MFDSNISLKVHSMLRTLPGSGLVMRLSLVAGACVCITVKCFNGELLDLVSKRWDAINSGCFCQGAIGCEKTAGEEFTRLPEGHHFGRKGENGNERIGTKGRPIQVDFVLDSNKEWLHVAEVMKRCQRCSSPTDQQAHTPPKTREVLSNALHPGPVDKEHKIAYATN